MIKSKYIFQTKIDSKIILIHLLTFNIVVLNEMAASHWQHNDFSKIDSSLLNELIKHKFIISKDEDSLFLKQNNFLFDIPKDEVSHTIFLTNKCNMCCPYCFEKDSKSRKISMDYSMIDNCISAINEITPRQKLKKILLFGGEPLIEDNRNIVDYVLSRLSLFRFKYIEIVTNGLSINNYVDLLEKYSKDIGSIRFTLNGNKDIHNKIRDNHCNKNTYDTILSSIKTVLNIGINVNVNLLYEKQNMKQFDSVLNDLYNLAESHNKAKLSIGFGRLQFRTSPNRLNYKHEISVENYYSNIILETQDSKYLPEILSGGEFPILWEVYKKLIGETSVIIPNIVPCRAVYPGRLCYYPDGKIYPCTDIAGEKEFAIGDFTNPPIKLNNSIWNQYDIKKLVCFNCKFIALCSGGCPVSNICVNGNINDVYCNEVQNTVENFLKSIYETGVIKNEGYIY